MFKKVIVSLFCAVPLIVGANEKEDWYFESPQKYEGQFSIEMPGAKDNYKMSQTEKGTSFKFPSVNFKEEEIGLIDVAQYGTPVDNITMYNDKDGLAEITLAHSTPISSFPRVKELNDKKYFIVSFKPFDVEEQKKLLKEKEADKFRGEKITLDFQDIPVRSVFKFIADFSGENIVVSDSVEGTVTVKLDQVRWDKALDIIMKTRGFGKRVMGDVTLIAPIDELNNAERAELQKANEIEQLIPLDTDYMRINYAKASEVSAFLNNIKSDRGKISFDERTNLLMMEDIPSKLAKMKNIVEQVDIAVEQVLIETRIVLATESASKEIGVTLSGVENSGDGALIEGGTGFADGIGGGSLSYTISNSLLDELDVRLAAIEEDGDGKTIARPKILTADKKEATVKTGTEIPYSTVGNDGEIEIEFREAVLSLKALPQITPDGNLIMDLVITQDSIGELTANGPAIDTTEIDTQVLVKDGETIVIGGIFRSDENTTVSGVPILKSIPLLGRLFRKDSITTERFELLFFITPKLVVKQNP